MPYEYLHRGNQYGLKNLRNGKIIWYDPEKVKSMERLKELAHWREVYSHGWRIPKKRGLANATYKTRQRVSSSGGRARRR